MDPIAKRFMWDVISRLSTRRGKTAIILTTHSMNEAQALCTRIGIMVCNQNTACLINLIWCKDYLNPFFYLSINYLLFKGWRPTKMHWEPTAPEDSFWKPP